MFVRNSLLLSVLVLAACGDDGGGSPADAPAGVDAPAATVMAVTCPGGTTPTIMTLATAFSPASTTITKGQIVQFVSTATHPVGPFPGGQMTDPGIVVAEGQTKCLMFTATGTFKFICTQHSYAGTIVVN